MDGGRNNLKMERNPCPMAPRPRMLTLQGLWLKHVDSSDSTEISQLIVRSSLLCVLLDLSLLDYNSVHPFLAIDCSKSIALLTLFQNPYEYKELE